MIGCIDEMRVHMIRWLVLSALMGAMPLCAATLTVTNLNDTGTGSLRQACTSAASGDDIVFQAGLAGSISFMSEINLGTKALTITGNSNGAGGPAITLNALASTRFLNTLAPLTLNLLAFTNGAAPGSRGGAIQVGDGTLTCIDCTFGGNSALRGGAIGTVGGATSTIQCTGCTFSGNAITSSGAAIYGNLITCTNCRLQNQSSTANNANLYGGAIYAESATCISCAFYNCELQADASCDAQGGAIWAALSATCSACLFSGCASKGHTSGNALVTGGAIRCDGSVHCTGCTFVANEASGAPNPAPAGGAIAGSDVVCTDCTFADNNAADGRCFYAFTALSVTNCILADSGTSSMFGGAGVLTSGGYNICTALAAGVAWLNATGDQPGTDPLLGPLQDNGGPVHTMLPAFNSPAIDQGGGTTTTTDARGLARPFDNAVIANATGGDGRDVGAVEFLFNAAPVITAPATLNVAPDTTHTFSGTVSVADADAVSGQIELTLAVTNGTLTLSTITGLTFTAGDGTADAAMTFSGTITAINAALNGMSFTPTTSYIGAATLQIDADDQGNSGDNGAKTDSETIAITVADVPEITLLHAGTPIASGGGDNAGSTGGPIAVTYTIRNDGVTTLNVGAISFANQTNCTVAVTTAPAATVAPAATSDFTITITPAAAGSFSFDMAITSDDADENPYNVHVVGNAASSGSSSGDDDDDEGCSTGEGASSVWLLLLGVALLAAWRGRRLRAAGCGLDLTSLQHTLPK